MDTTMGTQMTVPNLADGGTYYYKVTAVDMAGNVNPSALVSSTQDATPPLRPMAPMVPMWSSGTTLPVEWSPTTDRVSGMVEYMLEWAQDGEFSVGYQSSEWQPQTTYEIPETYDGVTFYIRVVARDGLGIQSAPSDMAMTTFDMSPPGIPVMDALAAFVEGPGVHLTWGPVTDASGLPVEYQVLVYDTDNVGATPIASSPWGPMTMYDHMGGPADAPLYFRVVARDHMGHDSGISDEVTCTIDGTGPSGAVIDELDAFTMGNGLTVSWSAATDDGIGGVMHRLTAYSDDGMTTRVFSGEWTMGTSTDVFGLADGATYWFSVECKDAFGNMGDDSAAASTTMDASPPMVAVNAPGYFGPTDGAVGGTCSDATSGVDSVEASGDAGANWVTADIEDGSWSVALGDLPAGATTVWVRATDTVGNMLGAYAQAVVDTQAPVVTIMLPTGGDDVSGAVTIIGSVSDAHLASYTVEVQEDGGSWMTVQPSTATTGVSGTLATWVTSGMTGGDYTIRVTATDALGQAGTASVDVTLLGAHLSIGTGDISFSDSHPLPGDMVTVFVTVRNDGDSPAENVVVTLSDKGKVVGSETVTVPAHGTAVVPVKVKASGSHDFTAQATSPLYDSGPMTTGQPLQTIEEEAALENAGGILGLLALLLALLAIILVFVMARRGGGAAIEPEPIPDDEIIVEPVLQDELMQEPPE
jgi:uncharacterized repeat protein (TIGR01451 family)